MKIISVALLSLLFHSFHSPASSPHNNQLHSSNDTDINHLLDGKTDEWPVQKFETDASTQIRYAIDNDLQNLYLALIIPDSHTQTRIMRQGMELYIDPKGKKKEGKGIEFPVKQKYTSDNSMTNFKERRNDENNGQENNEQRRSNMKAIRAAMALNLISMKVFGFSNGEPDEQGLQMAGSANIAFSWDSADVMHIEYRIPFSLFGNTSSLHEKDISIGLKLNRIEIRANSSSTEAPGGGRREGGFGGGGGGRRNFGSSGSGGQGNRSSLQDFENVMKDQSFWTKYMIKQNEQ